MKNCLFILCFLCIALSARSQEGWEAGGWLGISYYFGDLNPSFDLGAPGLAAGLIARHNFNNRICIKISGNYGNVSGDDARSENAFRKARNLSFKSVIFDGAAQLEFNFLPYDHGSKDHFFTPYLFGGFSAFYYNPKAKYNGKWVELRPLGTEGQFQGEEYYSISGGLVYGGGIKMDINYFWSLNLEISARRLFTDYLDDVSTVYPDKKDLEALRGELAVALSDRSLTFDGQQIGQVGRQRGDSKTKDAYVFVGLGLVYYFGDIRCPKFH